MSTIRPDLFTPPHKGNSQRAAQGLGSFYMSAEGLNQGEIPSVDESGEEVIVSGSGFGNRSSSFDYYDNYSAYSDGTTATEIGYSGNGGNVKIVSTDSHEVNGKSLEILYAAGGSHFPKNYLAVSPSDEIYLAFWAKWDINNPTAEVGIFKLVRGGSLPAYTGVPRFYETVRSDSSGNLTSSDRGFYADTYKTSSGALPFTIGEWHFCEYYFRLSTPGVGDGECMAWVDGIKTINLPDAITRTADQSSAKIEYFINFFDGLDQAGNDTYLRQSEEYAAGSRARVVITDNADYSLSTKFQIQPIVSWSDTSVVFSKRRGQFLPGSVGHIHVIDASNQIINTQSITL